MKQSYTKIGLEAADLLTDRALGHVQLTRGTRHAEMPADDLEDAQRIQRRQTTTSRRSFADHPPIVNAPRYPARPSPARMRQSVDCLRRMGYPVAAAGRTRSSLMLSVPLSCGGPPSNLKVMSM